MKVEVEKKNANYQLSGYTLKESKGHMDSTVETAA